MVLVTIRLSFFPFFYVFFDEISLLNLVILCGLKISGASDLDLLEDRYVSAVSQHVSNANPNVHADVCCLVKSC